MDDLAEITKMAEIDPELAELFQKIGPQPEPDWSDIAAMQAGYMEREQMGNEALGPPGPDIKESYQEITLSDGYKSKLKISQPTKVPTGGSPLIVLFHGGGFCLGSLDQMTPYARGYSKLFGATCVSADYRLAPDHPFPAATNDAFDSLKWIASNATSLGATPSAGFIVGGVSAGGQLAAITAHLAKDEKLSRPLTGQWLCVPLVLAEGIVPEKYKSHWISREQNAHAPGLNEESMGIFNKHWNPDWKSPLYSPFNRSSGFKGLPPAYIQVNGMDPLRDDGLIYSRVLQENGTKTKLDAYPGTPHGAFSFFRDLTSSKKCMVDMAKGIAWLLGTEVDESAAAKHMELPSTA